MQSGGEGGGIVHCGEQDNQRNHTKLSSGLQGCDFETKHPASVPPSKEGMSVPESLLMPSFPVCPFREVLWAQTEHTPFDPTSEPSNGEG